MGYDLNIWSVQPFDPAQLKRREKWKQVSDNFWHCPGKGWQIALGASTRVEPEDVPEEVAGLLPGIGWLTELNLEGDAPNAAMALARKSAKEIAKAAHGVVEDPQEDAITTPAGVKRYVPLKNEKKFSTLNFSWWFMTDVLTKREGREAFLNLLGKCLPEALPKRYGTYEPPEYKLEERGKEHLENFLGEQLYDIKVWYPQRPVTTVHVSCPRPLGGDYWGFRSNLLEIEIESAVLGQPGWKETLDRLWHEMTWLLEPIYGEVRTVHNQVRMGATVGMTAADFLKSMNFDEIVRGWFWRGIPPKLGNAVVLGREYQKLWPSFLQHAAMDRGFAFATTTSWERDEDLGDVVGAAPSEMVLLPGEGMGGEQEYPKVWPFGPPFG
jgi:hypothetical protein